MISEEDSWNLPRKFKIAFSHNDKDTAYTQATCLGFVAKIQNGQKGFEVYCAGGMGAKPMVGHQLFDFIPESRVYHVTRAMKTMFDKHGNRRNRYANRLKFLWKKIDRQEFENYFFEDYDKIKHDDSLNLELIPIDNSAKATSLPVQIASGPEFDLWKKRYVLPQKQPGLVSIKLPLILGDLLTDDAEQLCDFLENFSENTIRCERDQNMRLRNIPETYIGNAFHIIQNMRHSLAKQAPFIGNMINCTGASTCKLGICLPRGLSTAIRETLVQSSLDLDQVSDLKINMSGCPNTCGMHHIADIGFFGKVGRNNGDMYPAYNVLAGAQLGQAGQTQYAEKVSEIAAKHIPHFLKDFLGVYIPKKAQYKTFKDYLNTEGKALIQELCEKYKGVPDYQTDPTFYTDYGAKKRLSLDELGTAECSAGLFDMIEVDEKNIKSQRKALETLTTESDIEQAIYAILFSACRMLLVTRGLDAKEDAQVFTLFGKHFIEAELVSLDFNDVVVLGKLKILSELSKHKETVLKLAEAVIDLYKSMDDSLRFKVAPKLVSADEASTAVQKDYRGVACPMNFVKTKLVLETLQSGQKLEVLLDDGEPIQNVPNSVKLEGHKILEQKKVENHWVVLIEKK